MNRIQISCSISTGLIAVRRLCITIMLLSRLAFAAPGGKRIVADAGWYGKQDLGHVDLRSMEFRRSGYRSPEMPGWIISQ